MKKLIWVLLFALLVSCGTEVPDGDESTDPIVVAPDDPMNDTTTAEPKVTDPIDSTSEKKEDSSSASTSAPPPRTDTSATQVVPPVPMTYRLQYKAKDGYYYLLDADWSMACVEPEGNPVFHKSTVTEFNGGRIVYSSDLDTTLVVDKDNNVLAQTIGQLKSPVDGHWFLYTKPDAGKYRLYNLKTGDTFSGPVRGYNKRDDGCIVLLGEKEIYISDGEKLVETRTYSIIYYFASTYLLVREDGRLRFYDTKFNLLADWGEISGSNRIHFNETKRDGDKFEFFFDSGSFKYEPGQSVIEDAEIVTENDKLKLLYSGGKFYVQRGSKLITTDIPDMDLIYVRCEDVYITLIDRSYVAYNYYITDDDAVQERERYDESVKLGKLTAVNSFFSGSFLFDENQAIISEGHGDYGQLGSYIISRAAVGGNILSVHLSDGTKLTDCRNAYLLADGSIIVAEEKQFRIIGADGKVKSTSAEYKQVYNLVDGYLLVLDKDDNVKLVGSDGKVIVDFGLISDACDPSKGVSVIYYQSGKGAKNGIPAIYFTFEGWKSDGKYTAFEYYYIPSTGEAKRIDGVEVGALAKPVLYLYPEIECEVSVKFENPDRLTTVYPAYNDGWLVTARPDGTLTDARREYYALYWEENSPFVPSFNEGFCVAGEDAAAFLEEKLDALGFTNREANEFIMYWLPVLERSEYNLIYFELTDLREAQNALHISPAPDSLLRVAMHILPVDSPRAIAEQKLPTFVRDGFVAVEWGGRVYY